MSSNKIIGLIRASSDKQDTESQKLELKELLKGKGFSSEDIVWVEAHASATKINEAYDRLISEVKEKCLSDNIDNIGVWSLNRIGRREMPLIEFKTFCVEHKIQLYCFEPEFTLLNDDGTLNRMSSTIYNLWIEFIRSETEEREKKLKRGKDYVKSLGKYNGGIVQYGYRVDDEGRYLIDNEEANIVQRIFDLYASGNHSVYSVARELNLLKQYKKGKEWTGVMVHKVLSKKDYVGKDRTVPDNPDYSEFPAIIRKELFDKVNDMLSERKTRKTKEIKRVAYAGGLIRCTECGRKYYRELKLYQCIAKRNDGTYHGDCSSRSLNAEIIDSLLVEMVVPLHLKYLTNGYKNIEDEILNEVGENKVKIDSLREKINDIEKKKDKLMSDYYSGRINLSEKKYNELVTLNEGEKKKNLDMIELYENKIDVLNARLKLNRSQDDLTRFMNIYNQLKSLTVEKAENKSEREYVRDIIRMHVEYITTELDENDDKIQWVHIKLADGRNVDVRFRLQKGWLKWQCMGEIRVDDGEWFNLLFMGQERYGKRKMKFMRNSIFLALNGEHMPHDLYNKWFKEFGENLVKK